MAVPLAALAVALQRGGAGGTGQASGRVTPAVCAAHTAQAEKLEEQGKYAAAAALYRQNLDDDLRCRAQEGRDSTGLLPCAPTMWSYYGIALRRSGRTSEAIAAYEAGLRALAGRLQRDTPAWREHLRILLLDLMVQAQVHAHTSTAVVRTLPSARQGVAVYEFVAPSLRRCWRTACGPDPLGRPGNVGLSFSMYRIEEVAPPAALMSGPITEARCAAMAAATPPIAGVPDHERYGKQRKIPAGELPPAACHVCGAAPAKHCGRCQGVAYCGRECQMADWGGHKRQCKAAAAAAVADEAFEAAA